jgi:hypothetical protein
VAAVGFVMELLHCFASAARMGLEEGGGGGLDSEGGGEGRYLACVCVLLDWMRLHSEYMQLRDEEVRRRRCLLNVHLMFAECSLNVP